MVFNSVCANNIIDELAVFIFLFTVFEFKQFLAYTYISLL